MKKIETLKELRQHLFGNIEAGYREAIDTYSAVDASERYVIITGWDKLRIVIVGSKETGIRCCARADKKEGEVEVVVVRKPQIDNIGITQKNWAKIIPRCAAWLEKQGLYVRREVITDKTPDMFM